MAKKRREDSGGLDRLFELVEEAPAGLHDLDPPSAQLPPGLPEPLIELYARCDGGRLFHETILIAPAAEVTMPQPGRWQFATVEEDAISIDQRGRIWRTEEAIDDEVCDGTRLDRWLAGVVEATGLLYDGDGEFADNVFDEEGDLEPVVREKQLRLHLKRDSGAPGIRWRLAHALLEQGAVEDARNEMEQVVADDPAFAIAWLDLARTSEQLGEIKGAVDEARMAAESAEGMQHPQAGYFWSQVARLATVAGDDVLRAEAASRTSMLAPTLKQAQLAGVRESLAAGDTDSARGLVDLLRAVWPRDLEVLELARRVEGN
ncbi:MAG TPA: tetratricopeptide repeat protein [Kofleriaceae bacterium]|nr:tetratricopeptide repeat protein [Kofleriaceae bacterium]